MLTKLKYVLSNAKLTFYKMFNLSCNIAMITEHKATLKFLFEIIVWKLSRGINQIKSDHCPLPKTYIFAKVLFIFEPLKVISIYSCVQLEKWIQEECMPKMCSVWSKTSLKQAFKSLKAVCKMLAKSTPGVPLFTFTT